jgi:hypothetical protein
VEVSMARRVCRGAKDAGSGEQDVGEMHLEGVVGYDVGKECRIALAQTVGSPFLGGPCSCSQSIKLVYRGNKSLKEERNVCKRVAL